jgi:hypothetical protein
VPVGTVAPPRQVVVVPAVVPATGSSLKVMVVSAVSSGIGVPL